MYLCLERFVMLRPFLYHFTSPRNIDSIRSTANLRCAAETIKAAGRNGMLRTRRTNNLPVELESGVVQLQNQYPLQAANIAFEGGWNFEDVVDCLNSHVFFWPGTDEGPIERGMNHFSSKLWREIPAVIRVRTEELFKTSQNATPLFCPYNSGSPRWSHQRPSPRGPSTFLPAQDFKRTASEVVEVVFPGSVRLPEAAECGDSPSGPWRRFLPAS